MKHFIYVILAFTVTFASCDILKEEEKPKPAQSTVIDHPDGSTIAFASKTVSQEFKAPFTYTQAVTKPRNVDDDAGAITYTSSDLLIATVGNKGLVTFKKAEGGTVTITATKAATPENKYKQSEDSYTLTITRFSPTTKQALVNEIKEAMKALGNTADLTYIDTSAITDMSSLFRSDFSPTPETEGYGLHTFNGNISTWDTSSVETMEKMFKGNTAFNTDISGWTVNSVTNMNGMFSGATAFNQNISTWTVDSVTNMGSMFQGATSFNQAMSKWNVSNVENMRNMFQGATSFNQNIWEWAVDSVTDMRTMFHRATSFNKNIEKWDEHLRLGGRIVSKLSMFEGSALVTASTGLNYPTWCTSNLCRRNNNRK